MKAVVTIGWCVDRARKDLAAVGMTEWAAIW